ncbi:hypothetical protein CKA32_000627 [Geitlerinema sp. FC II]|nr:hypothetical protein CKA32_000627 [Geitlerinema sp. FC II]
MKKLNPIELDQKSPNWQREANSTRDFWRSWRSLKKLRQC